MNNDTVQGETIELRKRLAESQSLLKRVYSKEGWQEIKKQIERNDNTLTSDNYSNEELKGDNQGEKAGVKTAEEILKEAIDTFAQHDNDGMYASYKYVPKDYKEVLIEAMEIYANQFK